MYSLMCVLPVNLWDKKILEKFNTDWIEDLTLQNEMLLNEPYRAHAVVMLPWLNRREILDFNSELTQNSSSPKANKVPSWLDSEHFEEILKESVTDFGEILKITTNPATKSGDNYASTLLRVKVDNSINTISYILKLPLESEEESGIVTLWNFFDKEILMYSKYLREFEEKFGKAGEIVNFGPKYYCFKKDVGKDVLLLEDLSRRGFQNGDRRGGFRYETLKMCPKEIGTVSCSFG